MEEIQTHKNIWGTRKKKISFSVGICGLAEFALAKSPGTAVHFAFVDIV